MNLRKRLKSLLKRKQERKNLTVGLGLAVESKSYALESRILLDASIPGAIADVLAFDQTAQTTALAHYVENVVQKNPLVEDGTDLSDASHDVGANNVSTHATKIKEISVTHLNPVLMSPEDITGRLVNGEMLLNIAPKFGNVSVDEQTGRLSYQPLPSYRGFDTFVVDVVVGVDVGGRDIIESYQVHMMGDSSISENNQRIINALDGGYDRFKEIILVDERIADFDALIQSLQLSSEQLVFTIEQNYDGLMQASALLSYFNDLNAIHIVSHGSEGQIFLGSSLLTNDSITMEYKGLLQEIGTRLQADGDILIYGCEFARGDGELTLKLLSDITSADVAASIDNTGRDVNDANWVLETHVGVVETNQLTHDNNWWGVLPRYGLGGGAIAIPDNSQDGITSYINIQNMANMSSARNTAFDLEMTITHPRMKDLQIILISPYGKELVVANSVGTSDANWIDVRFQFNPSTTYFGQAQLMLGDLSDYTMYVPAALTATGNFGVQSKFSISDTEPVIRDFMDNKINPNGNWGLKIVDKVSGNVGTLNSWSINVYDKTWLPSNTGLNNIIIADLDADESLGPMTPYTSVRQDYNFETPVSVVGGDVTIGAYTLLESGTTALDVSRLQFIEVNVTNAKVGDLLTWTDTFPDLKFTLTDGISTNQGLKLKIERDLSYTTPPTGFRLYDVAQFAEALATVQFSTTNRDVDEMRNISIGITAKDKNGSNFSNTVYSYVDVLLPNSPLSLSLDGSSYYMKSIDHASLTHAGSFIVQDEFTPGGVLPSLRVGSLSVSGQEEGLVSNEQDLLSMLTLLDVEVLGNGQYQIDWAFDPGVEGFMHLKPGRSITLLYTIEATDGLTRDYQDIEIVFYKEGFFDKVIRDTGESSDDFITNNNRPVISGFYRQVDMNNLSIEVVGQNVNQLFRLGTSDEILTTLNDSQMGTWYLDLSNLSSGKLPDGSYLLRIRDNSNTIVEEKTLVIDTTPPAPALVYSINNQVLQYSLDSVTPYQTNLTSPYISGQLSTNGAFNDFEYLTIDILNIKPLIGQETIVRSYDSRNTGPLVVDVSQNLWGLNLQNNLILDPGQYEIRVIKHDLAGNQAEDRFSYELEIIPPNAPKILAIQNDSGIYSTDFITNDTTLQFSGSYVAIAGMTQLRIDVLSTTGTNYTYTSGNLSTSSAWNFSTPGTWTFTMPVAIAQGEYTVRIYAMDGSSNILSQSTLFKPLKIQTTMVAPTIQQSFEGDTGFSAQDGITADIDFKIKGTFDAANTTNLSVWVKGIQVPASSIEIYQNGTWMVDLALADTIDLQHGDIVTVKVVANNNVAYAHELSGFAVIDQQIVTPSLSLGSTDTGFSTVGQSVLDLKTKIDQPILKYHLNNNDIHQFELSILNQVFSGTITNGLLVGPSGPFSLVGGVLSFNFAQAGIRLSEGETNVAFKVIDKAGNSVSLGSQIVFDETPPSNVNLTLHGARTVEGTIYTRHNQPLLIGDFPSDAYKLSLTLKDGNQTSLSAISIEKVWQDGQWRWATIAVGDGEWDMSSGQWSWQPQLLTMLNDGAYSIVIEQVDVVGNSSVTSTSFVVDTTNPASPNGLMFSPDLGRSATDNITTSQDQIVVSGNAEALSEVEFSVYNNGLLHSNFKASVGSDGRFARATVFANGINTIMARTVDYAGNVSDWTSIELIIDNNSPDSFSIDDVSSDMLLIPGSRNLYLSIDNTPQFTGQFFEDRDIDYIKVQVVSSKLTAEYSSKENQSPLQLVKNGQQYSWALQLPELIENQRYNFSIKVLAYDSAGNVGQQTFTRSIYVDKDVSPAFDLSLTPDSGVSGDLVTNYPTTSLVGQAELGRIIKLINTQTNESLEVISDSVSGAWSIQGVSLVEGENHFQVVAVDPLFDRESSSSIVIRLDTQFNFSLDGISPDFNTLEGVSSNGQVDQVNNKALVNGSVGLKWQGQIEGDFRYLTVNFDNTMYLAEIDPPVSENASFWIDTSTNTWHLKLQLDNQANQDYLKPLVFNGADQAGNEYSITRFLRVLTKTPGAPIVTSISDSTGSKPAVMLDATTYLLNFTNPKLTLQLPINGVKEIRGTLNQQELIFTNLANNALINIDLSGYTLQEDNNLSFTLVDEVGNVSDALELELKVDQLPPSVNSIQWRLNGAVRDLSTMPILNRQTYLSNANSIYLEGTVSADVNTLSISISNVGQFSYDLNGIKNPRLVLGEIDTATMTRSWSLNMSGLLVDTSADEALITAKDLANNITTISAATKIDTIPPAIGTISGILAAPEANEYYRHLFPQEQNGLVNSRTLTFEGLMDVSAKRMVVEFSDGQSYEWTKSSPGQFEILPGGRWRLTASFSQDGLYSIRSILVTDPAENTTKVFLGSRLYQFNIDTVAPSIDYNSVGGEFYKNPATSVFYTPNTRPYLEGYILDRDVSSVELKFVNSTGAVLSVPMEVELTPEVDKTKFRIEAQLGAGKLYHEVFLVVKDTSGNVTEEPIMPQGLIVDQSLPVPVTLSNFNFSYTNTVGLFSEDVNYTYEPIFMYGLMSKDAYQFSVDLYKAADEFVTLFKQDPNTSYSFDSNDSAIDKTRGLYLRDGVLVPDVGWVDKVYSFDMFYPTLGLNTPTENLSYGLSLPPEGKVGEYYAWSYRFPVSAIRNFEIGETYLLAVNTWDVAGNMYNMVKAVRLGTSYEIDVLDVASELALSGAAGFGEGLLQSTALVLLPGSAAQATSINELTERFDRVLNPGEVPVNSTDISLAPSEDVNIEIPGEPTNTVDSPDGLNAPTSLGISYYQDDEQSGLYHGSLTAYQSMLPDVRYEFIEVDGVVQQVTDSDPENTGGYRVTYDTTPYLGGTYISNDPGYAPVVPNSLKVSMYNTANDLWEFTLSGAYLNGQLVYYGERPLVVKTGTLNSTWELDLSNTPISYGEYSNISVAFDYKLNGVTTTLERFLFDSISIIPAEPKLSQAAISVIDANTVSLSGHIDNTSGEQYWVELFAEVTNSETSLVLRKIGEVKLDAGGNWQYIGNLLDGNYYVRAVHEAEISTIALGAQIDANDEMQNGRSPGIDFTTKDVIWPQTSVLEGRLVIDREPPDVVNIDFTLTNDTGRSSSDNISSDSQTRLTMDYQLEGKAYVTIAVMYGETEISRLPLGLVQSGEVQLNFSSPLLDGKYDVKLIRSHEQFPTINFETTYADVFTIDTTFDPIVLNEVKTGMDDVLQRHPIFPNTYSTSSGVLTLSGQYDGLLSPAVSPFDINAVNLATLEAVEGDLILSPLTNRWEYSLGSSSQPLSFGVYKIVFDNLGGNVATPSDQLLFILPENIPEPNITSIFSSLHSSANALVTNRQSISVSGQLPFDSEWQAGSLRVDLFENVATGQYLKVGEALVSPESPSWTIVITNVREGVHEYVARTAVTTGPSLLTGVVYGEEIVVDDTVVTYNNTTGRYDLKIETSDYSNVVQAQIDLTPPVVNDLTPFNLSTDTGLYATDFISRDRTPILTGSIPPIEEGATIDLKIILEKQDGGDYDRVYTYKLNDALLGNTNPLFVNGSTWTLDLSDNTDSPSAPVALRALDDGYYRFKVELTVSDIASNSTQKTLTSSLYQVDTTISTPTISALRPIDDSGVLGDNITNDKNIVISGLSDPGDRVSLFNNGQFIDSVLSNVNGQWSYDYQLGADGIYKLSVRSVDLAGNLSAYSSLLSFELDSQVVAPSYIGMIGDTGVSDIDGITKHNQLLLKGTFDAADVTRMSVMVNGVTFSTDSSTNPVYTNSKGNWLVDVSSLNLAPGAYDVLVQSFDVAGNASEIKSYVDAISIDNEASTVSFDAIGVSSGKLVVNGITNDPRPVISGQFNSDGIQSVRLIFGDKSFDDRDLTGQFEVDYTNGDWRFQPNSNLADATYQIRVYATDQAGNEGYNNFVFTVRTASIALPTINAVVLSEPGQINGTYDGLRTQDPVLTIKREGQSTVLKSYTTNNLNGYSFSNGQWLLSVTPALISELGPGKYELVLSVKDKSNTTISYQDISALELMIVNQAPPVPIIQQNIEIPTGIKNGLITNNNQNITFQGSFDGSIGESTAKVVLFLDSSIKNLTVQAQEALDDVLRQLSNRDYNQVDASLRALLESHDIHILGTVLPNLVGQNWQFETNNLNLSHGMHSLQALTLSSSGLYSAISEADLSFEIDTKAMKPTLTLTNDNGLSSTDRILTGPIQPAFSGSYDSIDIPPGGITATIFNASNQAFAVNLSILPNGNYTFSAVNPLALGQYTAKVVVTDSFSNQNEVEMDFSIVAAPSVNWNAPTLSPLSPTREVAPLVNGHYDSANTTNIEIVLTKSSLSYTFNKNNGLTLAPSSGTWALDLKNSNTVLEEGSWQIEVKAFKNAELKTATGTLVVDLSTNMPIINNPPDGQIVAKSILDHFSLSGTAEKNSAVNLIFSTGQEELSYSTSTNALGQWQGNFDLSAMSFDNNELNVTVQSIDALGNQSAIIEVEYLIDSSPSAKDDLISINENESKYIDLQSMIYLNDSDISSNAAEWQLAAISVGENVNLISTVSGTPYEIKTNYGRVTYQSGAGGFQYTPDANYIGEDIFSYQIKDDSGLSNFAAIRIVVNNLDDSPVITAPERIDRPNSEAFNLGEFIDLYDIDSDNLSLSMTVTAGQLECGVIQASSISETGLSLAVLNDYINQISFIPSSDAIGAELTIQIQDSQNTVSKTIRIDYPTLTAPSDLSLQEDVSASLESQIKLNNLDNRFLEFSLVADRVSMEFLPVSSVQIETIVNGLAQTIKLVGTGADINTLLANATLKSLPDYFGNDGSLEIVVRSINGESIFNQNITISVSPVNDVPLIRSEIAFEMVEDVPKTIFADVDLDVSPGPSNEGSQTLSYRVDALDSEFLKIYNGVTEVTNEMQFDTNSLKNLQFKAKDNWHGQVGFTLYASDNEGLETSKTFYIDVLNDTPTLEPLQITMNEDSVYRFQPDEFKLVDPNDSDIEHVIYEVQIMSLPHKGGLYYDGALMTLENGVIRLDDLSKLSYVPPLDEHSVTNNSVFTSFSMIARDVDHLVSGTMEVQITVQSVVDQVRIETTVEDYSFINEENSTLSGTIVIKNPDAAVTTNWVEVEIEGQYGTLSLTPNSSNPTIGEWHYQLDITNPNYLALIADEIAVETITLESSDGTTYQLDIQIQGKNDEFEVGNSSQLTPDVTIGDDSTTTSTTGVISISDADFNTHSVKEIIGNNVYGSLSAEVILDEHNQQQIQWQYEVENKYLVGLAGGEIIHEQFSIVVEDELGLLKTIQITLNVEGIDDSVIFESDSQSTIIDNDTVPMNGNYELTGSVLLVEPDLNQGIDEANIHVVLLEDSIAGNTPQNVIDTLITALEEGFSYHFDENTSELHWSFVISEALYAGLSEGEYLVLQYQLSVNGDDYSIPIELVGHNASTQIDDTPFSSESETLNQEGQFEFYDSNLSNQITAVVEFVGYELADHSLSSDVIEGIRDALTANIEYDGTRQNQGDVVWQLQMDDSWVAGLGNEELVLNYTISVYDGLEYQTKDFQFIFTGEENPPVINVINESGDRVDVDNVAFSLSASSATKSGSFVIIDPDYWSQHDVGFDFLAISGSENVSSDLLVSVESKAANWLDVKYNFVTNQYDWAFNVPPDILLMLSSNDTVHLDYKILASDHQDANLSDTVNLSFTIEGVNDAPVLTVKLYDLVDDGVVELTDWDSIYTEVSSNTTTVQTGYISVLDETNYQLAFETSLTRVIEMDLVGDEMIARDVPSHLLPSEEALGEIFSLISNAGGEVNVDENSRIQWEWDASAIDLTYLKANEFIALVYEIKVTDQEGATETQEVYFIIIGQNDAPVVDSAQEYFIDENNLDLEGGIDVFDADQNDEVVISIVGSSWEFYSDNSLQAPELWSSLFDNALKSEEALSFISNMKVSDGVNDLVFDWTYDPEVSAPEWMAHGEELVIRYDLNITDGTAVSPYQLTIKLRGMNDAPEMVSDQSSVAGEVLERTDGVENTAPLSDTGTLTFADIDLSDTHTAEVLAQVKDGLDNVIESPLGTLTLGDVDQASNTVSWTYAVDAAALDYLAAGQTLTQVYTVQIKDNSGESNNVVNQTVTIMITGTNDAPVIKIVESNDDSDSAVFDETNDTLSASGTLSVTDLDVTNTVAVTVASLSTTGPTNDIAENLLLAYLEVDEGNIINNTATTGTINWSFNSGANTFDYLAAGEMLTLTYTVRVTDSSGASDDQAVTITITGTNDAPVIDTIAETALNETTNDAAITGDITVDFADADLADVAGDYTATITGVVPGGVMTGLALDAGALKALIEPGEITNAANSTEGSLVLSFEGAATAFNYLADGEVLTLAYTLMLDDGKGGEHTQNFTVKITGTNDGPVAVADTATATENAAVTVDVISNDTDVDASDVLSLKADNAGIDSMTFNGNVVTVSTASVTQTGNLITFNPGTDFDFLAVGESATVVINYTVQDNNVPAAESNGTLTITVTGTNDAPTIVVASSDVDGEVTERADGASDENTGQFTDTGALTFADVDLSDTHTAEVLAQVKNGLGTVIASPLGMLTLGDVDQASNTVSWTYAVDAVALDYLAAGQTLTQVYTVQIKDNCGESNNVVNQSVTITITGTNDAPTIVVASSDVDGEVTERADGVSDENTGQLTDTGTLTFADVDLSDTHIAEVLAQVKNGLGTVIASPLGMLTLGDVDQASNTVSWTYAVDAVALDYLAAGQTLTQVYTVQIKDNSGESNNVVNQSVTITITGTNDAPVIKIVESNDDSDSAVLDETNDTLSASGTLSVTDLDVTNTVAVTVTSLSTAGPTNGIANSALRDYLTVNAGDIISSTTTTGTINWSFNSGTNTFDYLVAGEMLTLTYTVRVTDSSGASDDQAVTITITGTNDAPVIDTIAETALNETTNDAAITGNITVGFIDVDLTDVAEDYTATITGVVSSGVTSGLTLDTEALKALIELGDITKASDSSAGGVVLSFNGEAAAFDYLADGEILTLTYTLMLDDGKGGEHTQNFTVMITGTNDAPTIDGGVVFDMKEDSEVLFNEANLNLSLKDSDIYDKELSIVMSVDKGTLRLIDSSVEDSIISFSSSLDGLNQLLRDGVMYRPTDHYNGSAELLITTWDDMGAVAVHKVDLFIEPVADKPSVIFPPLNPVVAGGEAYIPIQVKPGVDYNPSDLVENEQLVILVANLPPGLTLTDGVQRSQLETTDVSGWKLGNLRLIIPPSQVSDVVLQITAISIDGADYILNKQTLVIRIIPSVNPGAQLVTLNSNASNGIKPLPNSSSMPDVTSTPSLGLNQNNNHALEAILSLSHSGNPSAILKAQPDYLEMNGKSYELYDVLKNDLINSEVQIDFVEEAENTSSGDKILKSEQGIWTLVQNRYITFIPFDPTFNGEVSIKYRIHSGSEDSGSVSTITIKVTPLPIAIQGSKSASEVLGQTNLKQFMGRGEGPSNGIGNPFKEGEAPLSSLYEAPSSNINFDAENEQSFDRKNDARWVSRDEYKNMSFKDQLKFLGKVIE